MKQANLEQYRSRSAYKLIELDDKFHFLQKGSIVVSIFMKYSSHVVHTAILAEPYFVCQSLKFLKATIVLKSGIIIMWTSIGSNQRLSMV